VTEQEARQALLVRAYETPPAAPWTAADAAWASSEAAREEGEQAAPERLIATRARLAAGRLVQRDPPAGAALRATAGHAWLAWALLAAALVVGLASDAIGPSQRINILAPPLLMLMLWNVLVYIGLAVAALRGKPPTGGPRRWIAALWRRWLPASKSPALARFIADWAGASGPLLAARAGALLHAAAAALVLGLLASLYLRGLAFEYRAGWDSTFLSADVVHGLLSWLLGPASLLSGLPLPGADELARLRFSQGGSENAARWIHLHALTATLVVLLPRVVLALVALLRAQRLGRHFPLALDDVYFTRLLHAHAGHGSVVRVLPYSYSVPAEALSGLELLMKHAFGANTQVAVMPTVPLGGEDDLALPPSAGSTLALFAMTATPERETHGAFVEALRGIAGPAVTALVDESGFRQRLSGPQAASRIEQRRKAWASVMRDAGCTPLFVNLAAPEFDAAAAQLQRPLHAA
jgi:hypothetical protein